MPELPEVEVVRRGIDQWVAGRTVESVTVLHARAVRRHEEGPADLAARLTGRRMQAPRRRGKYLWIPLEQPKVPNDSDWYPAPHELEPAPQSTGPTPTSGGEALLAHLGMSGQLLVGEPDRPYEKHLRVRMDFADGGLDLRFVDQRTFGHLLVAETVDGIPEPIRHIAPDPFEEVFDEETFVTSLRRRHTGIKRALLDQSLISGVGNIYADEALWRARLHWARPTETLTKVEGRRVLDAVREVMGAALTVGGTSFDSLYVNVNGESGYFDRSLNAYGRRDEPCPRCGTPIRRDVFMNRSSYSCPKCQPRPRRGHW